MVPPAIVSAFRCFTGNFIRRTGLPRMGERVSFCNVLFKDCELFIADIWFGP